jgi:hypothetical protein
MAEALTEFEGGRESLAGKLALAESEVSKSTKVETVRLSPRIGTVRLFGAAERIASVLQSFTRVGASREERFGEGEAEVDGVFPKAAGVRQQDAGFGFGDGLRVISKL